MRILVLLVLGLASFAAADINTWEESEEFSNVITDPLDSAYYGLPENEGKYHASLEQDDTDEDNEPLGDIDDALDEVLDAISEGDDIVEETEEEVLEEEDEDEMDGDSDDDNDVGRRSRWNKKRKQKMWKKHGKTSRKISKFMNNKNIDDMSEVPKRMFKGPLRRIHKLAIKKEQNGIDEQGKRLERGPMKKIYRKITKRVHKKINKENDLGNKLKGICGKLNQRTEPRQGVMKHLPHSMQNQFLSMFQKRREQLLQCCEKENEDQKTCFIQANREKQTNICILVEQSKLANESSKIISHWQRKTHCCDVSDEDSREMCFRKAGKAMRIFDEESREMCIRKAGKFIRKERWQKKRDPETRLNHMCQAVSKPLRKQTFKKRFSQMNEEEIEKLTQKVEERRKQMSLCCQIEDQQEKVTCVTDLRKERLDRVCSGEEDLKPQPKIKARHDILVDTCCQKAGDERWNCFTDRKQLRQKLTNKKHTNEQEDNEKAVVHVEIEIEEEKEVDRDDSTEDSADYYDYADDAALNNVDDDGKSMIDRMMGDAPIEETENEDSVRGDGRQQRKNKRVQARQTRQECCTGGRQAAAEMPRDGKAMAMRNQECGYKAEAFVAEREMYKNFCTKIFKRCCGRNEDPNAEDHPRLAARKERKEQRKAGRKGQRQRNRQERRRVKVDVEVEGDGNEGLQEAEDIMEEIIDKVQS